MSKKLNVFFEKKKVGELQLHENDRYEFQYDPQWIGDVDTFSISLALPLQTKAFEHTATKSFFEGLIPEGDFLKRLEMLSENPIETAFDFLTAYGRDCAGALVITPNSETFAASTELKQISWPELSKAFIEQKTLANVILHEEGGFFSLAGAQDKISLVEKGSDYFVATGGQATTHIIKPPNRYHKALDSVYNEHLCMRLADKVGLEVPKTLIIEDEIAFYVIERYDRKLVKNKELRLHQQDFCQASGVLSSQKYEIMGGPTIKQNYQLIINHSGNVINDSRRYLKWILFNLLIGNNDSHSKNLSFLMDKQSFVLAPFYDILSTAVYPTVRNKFAFKIAGQVQWAEINSKHLRIVEKELNLKQFFFGEMLETIMREIEVHLPKLLVQMKMYREKNIFEKLESQIFRRIKHFKNI